MTGGDAKPAMPPPHRADAAAAPHDWLAGGFGVYVHWPFCAAKCPYCDFNSHVAKAAVDQPRWRAALLAEMEAARAATGPRRADTVFFGGGTPSLMPPETVAALVEAVDRLWGVAPGAEITLEANPTSVEAGRFRGYALAGVNRVSMGVQALNDRDLRALGRMHSAAEARAAFDVARAAFERVSFDLIYAREGQTPAAWAAELRAALAMAVDHLSLYQLTIEPGTAFGARFDAGKLTVPPDDDAATMYLETQEVCAAAGLPAYEVSNHARPGAESRHNRVYWRYGDYAGVGPGAHGRITGADGARRATVSPSAPGAWLAAVERGGGPSWAEEVVAPPDQATEYLMMALRLTEGADLARFARLNGAPLDPARIAPLVEDGLATADGDRIAATAAGRPVLNALLRALLA
ncbi:oxygen-independent coproporphyrinogen-3 oxidase [Rubrimonas cliftonensis]|uniref:Heme chaperone HemW n=2 Tax=Rubrimonas cliftonensis TaxID=89524 RepID=A0A1H4F9A2_9RHOB|nr:oxygen-independent coproporphyrinogen-3 oxidase [Rubrimonas cliftonensis]